MNRRQRIDNQRAKKLKFKPLQFTAKGSFLRCPPSKAGLMARLLPGLYVQDAINLMRNSPTSAARLLTKVLFSAMYNAANGTRNVEVDDLQVDKVLVDKGRFLKRHHPLSHGKADPILKRTCHITVILKEAPKN
jgi:large subunit ribosomal protein L22